jgi:hypothetical protein
MRVDRLEVELCGDQEDDRLDRGQARESASAALGGLEQAVDGFEEAIGLTGLRSGHDALKVTSHERGHLLHRLDLAVHDAGAPVLEHGAHDVDLFALKDLAQLLLEPHRDRRRLVDLSHTGIADCFSAHRVRGRGATSKTS